MSVAKVSGHTNAAVNPAGLGDTAGVIETDATRVFQNIGDRLAEEAKTKPALDQFGRTPAQEELTTALKTYYGRKLDSIKDASAAVKADLATPGGKAVAESLGIRDAKLVAPPASVAATTGALRFAPVSQELAPMQEFVESTLHALAEKSPTFQNVLDAATDGGKKPISFVFGEVPGGYGASFQNSTNTIRLDPSKVTQIGDIESAAIFELTNASNVKSVVALNAEADAGAFKALAKDLSVDGKGPAASTLYAQNIEAVEWYGTQTQHAIAEEGAKAKIPFADAMDYYGENYKSTNGQPAKWADFNNYYADQQASGHSQAYVDMYDKYAGKGRAIPEPEIALPSRPADALPTDGKAGNPKVKAAAAGLEGDAQAIASSTRNQVFRDINADVARGGQSAAPAAVKQANAAVQSATTAFVGKAVTAANAAAKALGKAAPAINAALLSKAVYDDVQKGDTAAHETRAALGGIGGGIAGAELGAVLGTTILPGVGTLIGGLVGGVGGAIAGAKGASASVFDDAVSSAVKVVQDVSSKVKGAVSAAGETIGQFLANVTSAAGQAGSGAVGWLASWFAPSASRSNARPPQMPEPMLHPQAPGKPPGDRPPQPGASQPQPPDRDPSDPIVYQPAW